MKNFYISAWGLFAAVVVVSFLTGSFNPVSLFVLSLVALVLVLALAMWSVITHTWNLKTE